MNALDGIMPIFELALRLGDVERATRTCSGRRESVGAHSTSLAILLMQCIRKERDYVFDLALGLQYAALHDLPEAICGDTVTLHALTKEQAREKKEREADALAVIEGHDEGIAEIIKEYESLSRREAAYVHALDKVLPRLTHIMDGCTVPMELGMSKAELRERVRLQNEHLVVCTPKADWLHKLLEDSAETMLRYYPDNAGPWMLSWWAPLNSQISLVTPWWVATHDPERGVLMAALVLADSSAEAKRRVQGGYPDGAPWLTLHDIELLDVEKLPFGGLFPRRPDTKWPEKW